jgi:hypothetical protein
MSPLYLDLVSQHGRLVVCVSTLHVFLFASMQLSRCSLNSRSAGYHFPIVLSMASPYRAELRFCVFRIGGGKRTRTADILLAKQALYQLSYTPT